MRELLQANVTKKLPSEVRAVLLRFFASHKHLYVHNPIATAADAAAVSSLFELVPWRGE